MSLYVLCFLLIDFFLLITPVEAYNKVLLISVDGSHPDIVRNMIDTNQLPTMQLLLNSGGGWHDLQFTDQRPEYPTVTKPGHAQMHTGLTWHETGIFSNLSWTGPIQLDLTLLGQWKKIGAITGWFVAKRHIAEFDGPTGLRGPFYNVWNAATCKAYKANITSITDRALICLNTYLNDSWFFFVHYHHPDAIGHQYGSDSQQYRNSLINVDAQIKRLLDVVSTVNAQIVLTTDHGFGTIPRLNKLTLPTCEALPGSTKHHWCERTWAISYPALTLGNRLLDIAPALRP